MAFGILRNRHTHTARLERWLGAEQVETMSRSMRDWYGPPIAVASTLAGTVGQPVAINVWATDVKE